MGNLRQRAAGQDIAKTDEVANTDLAVQIRKMEEQFQMAMPKGVEATQLVRDAITVLRQTPKLAECDPQSVLGALMTCAQLGLRVGVLGHAWVLPFKDKHSRGHKAQLIIGYQGLVELAHRSDRVASLMARTVYENDDFDIAYGLEDKLEHRPYRGDGDRGEPVGYYAMVKMLAGGHAFIFMTRREAEMHRDANAMAKTREGNIVGPWRDHFDAMAMKTCVIKLSKWMPKSTDLARAIEADGGIRIDTTPDRQPEEATHQVIIGTASEVPDDGGGPNLLEQAQERVMAAGAPLSMNVEALEAAYADQYDGADLRSASIEELDRFTALLATWVNPQEDVQS
jgi:recombination protein RecT